MLSNAHQEGMQFLEVGDLRSAEMLFRQALDQYPEDLNARHGLGIVALRAGDARAALSLFDQVLARASDQAHVMVNRGLALAALGQTQAAVESFTRALTLAPSLQSASINLANVLAVNGELDAAIVALEAALQLVNHESAELLNNAANLYKDRGDVSRAKQYYQRAFSLAPHVSLVLSNYLCALKVDPTLSSANVLREHKRWSGWFESVSSDAPLLENEMVPDRVLRIGYVSPDCHTALPAFLDAIFRTHDRSRFSVFAYFNNPQSSERIAELQLSGCARVMRGKNDAEVAALIFEDRIDVLIDIAGHTGHNRLGVFARRPAPLQVSWLDYLGTTGLSAMDYRVTDSVSDPAGSESGHSERLLRMSNTQWCWTPPPECPAVADLPALRNDHLTFGSFNNVQKLTDVTLECWSALLRVLPTSRLKLVGIPSGLAQTRIIDLLGCDAARLDFLPRVSVSEYRQSFADVDIALDTFPFSGATTTLDAMWQGVPVLTRMGERSCSRSSASILTTLGLQNWTTSSAADYVEQAVRLTSDAHELAELRSALRGRVRDSALTNVPQFVAEFEKLLLTAWQSKCGSAQSVRRLQNDQMTPLVVDADTAQIHRARAACDAMDPERAFALLKPLFSTRPEWSVLRQEVVRVGLLWARQHPEARAAWQEPVASECAPQTISAVVCSIHPEKFEKISFALKTQFADHDFEIIGIHNAQSLCEGYNRGARKARGDVLIFCHDDISFPLQDFGKRVLSHLQRLDLVGVAGASKLVNGRWGDAGPPWCRGQVLHVPPDGKGFLYFVSGLHGSATDKMVALDGVFLATHRSVWQSLQFDERTFDGFHLYDIDFSYRAHLAGYRIGVPLDLLLLHQSTGRFDAAWRHYHARFLEKFSQLDNIPSRHRVADIHVKLQSIAQVSQLHAALRHFQFGHHHSL